MTKRGKCFNTLGQSVIPFDSTFFLAIVIGPTRLTGASLRSSPVHPTVSKEVGIGSISMGHLFPLVLRTCVAGGALR